MLVTTTSCVLLAILGGALLCRSAGHTRGRTDSVLATKAYQIGGHSYTLEYRHCVTTGLYSVFVHHCPPNPHRERLDGCGVSTNGEIWMRKEVRWLEHAEAIAWEWMESYSDYIQAETRRHRLAGT